MIGCARVLDTECTLKIADLQAHNASHIHLQAHMRCELVHQLFSECSLVSNQGLTK